MSETAQEHNICQNHPETDKEALGVVAEALENTDLAPQALEKRDPDRAIKILYMLAEHRPYSEIMGACSVDKGTIVNLKKRQPDILSFLAERARANTATVVDMLTKAQAMKAKQLIEDPEQLAKANIKDISLATGITIDKAQLLQGKATSITENRGSENREKLAEMVKEAQRRVKGKVIDAETGKEVEE